MLRPCEWELVMEPRRLAPGAPPLRLVIALSPEGEIEAIHLAWPRRRRDGAFSLVREDLLRRWRIDRAAIEEAAREALEEAEALARESAFALVRGS